MIYQERQDISIHALLAESDAFGPSWLAPHAYFYPRSPCGERLKVVEPGFVNKLFLSTLSLRRATRLGLPGWLRTLISIHALLAESDGGSGVGSWPRVIFLSTLSLRRATQILMEVLNYVSYISIHALLAESDAVR